MRPVRPVLLIPAILVLSLSVAPPAHAVATDYTITNQQLKDPFSGNDSGTVSGSFTYDPDNFEFSQVTFFTTTGGEDPFASGTSYESSECLVPVAPELGCHDTATDRMITLSAQGMDTFRFEEVSGIKSCTRAGTLSTSWSSTWSAPRPRQ